MNKPPFSKDLIKINKVDTVIDDLIKKIRIDTLIFVDRIFDSMGFLGQINFIEDHFYIMAEDAELLEENFESVNAIGGFIKRKLN
jgi:acyl carrier protein